MHYIVEYEVCALIFLLIVAAKFFGVRRFPSRLNRLFGIILYCAVADVALDIFSAFTIEYGAYLPVWLNYAVNTVFYSLQILFPCLMMQYVICMSGRSTRRSPALVLFFLPAAVFECLLLFNVWTGMLFYMDAGVYTHGRLFPLLYAETAFYLLSTAVLVIRSRRVIRHDQYTTILAFVLVIAAAVVIQFLFPQALLTGVSIAIAIIMIYFTLQNPESMLDLISGTFNYTMMNDFLLSRISEDGPMWLIALDVGGMRFVNSSFGVQKGNVLLGRIGQFLNAAAGKAHVFRMISMRFLIVADRESDCAEIIRAVEERFRTGWELDGQNVALVATICHFGTQDFFSKPGEVTNLIETAFQELGADRAGTTNEIDAALLQLVQRRMAVDRAIRTALESGEGLRLDYQPIYSAAEKRFCSVEALLRLETPELGVVSPAEFIPISERSGQILRIDAYVIGAAGDFLRRHPELPELGIEYVEINLSAAEFSGETASLAERVRGLEGLRPSSLCFEVTETAASGCSGPLSAFMTEMNARGFSFALDDFGTGYANISRIVEMPFSIIKIDRSLLSGTDRDQILYNGLLQLFRRMGLKTVVEGVETAEQAQRVLQAGADHIQGFYYARPMREAQLIDCLQNALSLPS